MMSHYNSISYLERKKKKKKLKSSFPSIFLDIWTLNTEGVNQLSYYLNLYTKKSHLVCIGA